MAYTDSTYTKRRYHDKKAAGICVTNGCNLPALSCGIRCADHYAYLAEKQAKHRRKNHVSVFTALGGKCSRCGLADWRVLQLDHVTGNGREERNARGASWKTTSAYTRHILENLDSYQLLCANCHVIKGIETATGYGAHKRIGVEC